MTIFDPTAEPLPDDPARGAAAAGAMEYRAPDNTLWRCEQAEHWQSDYHVTGTPAQITAKLREWHAALSPVPGTWNIVRRYYGFAPLLGGAALEDLRDWSVRDIALQENVSADDIERHLVETQTHWARTQLEAGLLQRMAAKPKAALDRATGQELLVKYGFGEIEDEAERAYVLQRVADLSHLLEMETGRPIALAAIFQELVLNALKRALLLEMKKPSATKDIAKKHKEYLEAQAQYEKTMETLGATQEQNPGFRRKVAFNDCVAQLARAIQEYYARHHPQLPRRLRRPQAVHLVYRVHKPESRLRLEARPDGR